MTIGDSSATITAEGFDARLGACQDLAVFAIIDNTTSEAMKVGYRIDGRDVVADTDDAEDGTP